MCAAAPSAARFQMTARAPRSRPVTRTLLDFRGTLTGDSLRSALSLPASMPIGGQTDWHAVLRMAPEPARERSLPCQLESRGTRTRSSRALDPSRPAAELPASVDVQWPASGGSTVAGGTGVDAARRGDSRVRCQRAQTRPCGASPSAAPIPRSATAKRSIWAARSMSSIWRAGSRLGLMAPRARSPWRPICAPRNSRLAASIILGLSFLDVTLVVGGKRRRLAHSSGRPECGGLHFRCRVRKISSQPWDLDFERLKFIDDSDADAGDAPEGGAGPPPRADPHSIPADQFSRRRPRPGATGSSAMFARGHRQSRRRHQPQAADGHEPGLGPRMPRANGAARMRARATSKARSPAPTSGKP